MQNEDEHPPKVSGLASKLSHDMRSPITSIQGFAELMLKDDAITGQSREFLNIIIEESRSISAMLNKFSSALERSA
ncbi:MAG: hypothetical protein H7070_09240 [Saprospiraceae bacterium]|nr:hypothetical protein [Pyrinomonadaceae bacterium]